MLAIWPWLNTGKMSVFLDKDTVLYSPFFLTYHFILGISLNHLKIPTLNDCVLMFNGAITSHIQPFPCWILNLFQSFYCNKLPSVNIFVHNWRCRESRITVTKACE